MRCYEWATETASVVGSRVLASTEDAVDRRSFEDRGMKEPRKEFVRQKRVARKVKAD